MRRYLLWSLERKHWKLWGFWIPLAVLIVIAIVIAWALSKVH
jgi:hypothetical protein